MEAELIREIISLLKDLKAGVSVNWISIVLIGIIVLITSFLGSYIRRKGQNLATKEDLSEITNKIEGIKADYAKNIETSRKDQYLDSALIPRNFELLDYTDFINERTKLLEQRSRELMA